MPLRPYYLTLTALGWAGVILRLVSQSRSRYVLVSLSRRWWATGLDHLTDELGANLGGRFVLGKGDVGQVRGVADDARVRVAGDVGSPFPRRRVRVAGPDVFGLQPFEFLLGAQLVRLWVCGSSGLATDYLLCCHTWLRVWIGLPFRRISNLNG